MFQPPLRYSLTRPANYRCLYVDMNGFFASIEQQDNPELRGKPVSVVSHAVPRGSVLASSYEAKAYGIKTGMRVADALALCPNLIYKEGRGTRYKEVHHQIMGILRDLAGPEVQPRSIDEAAVYMAPNWQTREKALELAELIKSRIRTEIGEYVKCSIGIAPNSSLAKTGTDLQKPDGLVEITLENTRTKLESQPITLFAGIAEKMAKRFEKIGITSAVELYDADAEYLRHNLGILGQYWWWRLHGYEPDGNVAESTLKSMSHEHVLKKWTQQKYDLEKVAMRMIDRLIHRLYKNGFQCTTVAMGVKLSGAPTYYRERKLDSPTFSRPILTALFREMMDEIPANLPFPARKLVFFFGGLTRIEAGSQLNLFEDTERGLRASEMVGSIRLKHGFDSIHLASTIRLPQKIGHESIGFGRIKDVA